MGKVALLGTGIMGAPMARNPENDHSAYMRYLEAINPGKRFGSGDDLE